MVNVYTFFSTLKIRWPQMLCVNEGPQSSWATLYPILSKLSLFGQGYADVCFRNIGNPSWADLLKHYTKLCKTKRTSPTKLTDIYEEPINFNKNVKRARKIIHDDEWVSLGILKIKHVLDDDGEILSSNELKNRYTNVNTNIRLYAGISNVINKYQCEKCKLLCEERFDK